MIFVHAGTNNISTQRKKMTMDEIINENRQLIRILRKWYGKDVKIIQNTILPRRDKDHVRACAANKVCQKKYINFG